MDIKELLREWKEDTEGQVIEFGLEYAHIFEGWYLKVGSDQIHAGTPGEFTSIVNVDRLAPETVQTLTDALIIMIMPPKRMQAARDEIQERLNGWAELTRGQSDKPVHMLCGIYGIYPGNTYLWFKRGINSMSILQDGQSLNWADLRAIRAALREKVGHIRTLPGVVHVVDIKLTFEDTDAPATQADVITRYGLYPGLRSALDHYHLTVAPINYGALMLLDKDLFIAHIGKILDHNTMDKLLTRIPEHHARQIGIKAAATGLSWVAYVREMIAREVSNGNV